MLHKYFILMSAMIWAPASGQIVIDGDFDGLDPGTNPDCSDPAGAWGFITVCGTSTSAVLTTHLLSQADGIWAWKPHHSSLQTPQ